MRNLIIGLARPMLRLIGRDDRGGVGVIIGILLGGGVLLGMGVLTVDVGQLYGWRAQLQNGADAGALAVAKSCAQGACAPALAQTLANLNAKAGAASVPTVCGTGMGACPLNTGKITQCPSDPVGKNFVDVYTETPLVNGTHNVPPILARALIGNSGYQGSAVGACAQAEWGPPKTATTIGFTISACEWDYYTQTYGFGPPPPTVPTDPPTVPAVIALHSGTTGGTSSGCPYNPADGDAPGAFGWLSGLTCSVTIVNNTYTAQPGASGNNCASVLPGLAKLPPQPVYVPVYSAVAYSGAGTTYTLKGFATFVITGYTNLPAITPKTSPDWLLNNLGLQKQDCSAAAGGAGGSSANCIDGYFVKDLIPSAGGTGGTDLGTYNVTLSG